MSDLFDLTGRVAVITGASRGLGQYFGRALARAGADLVITSRTRESLDEFEDEIRGMVGGPCPSSSTCSTSGPSAPWPMRRSRPMERSTSS